MYLPFFELKTVKSFLEYIYANKTKDEGREFDASKYTAALLRMAHMYQCEELIAACINHLKDNISEANSAEVFAAARLVDSKALKEEIFTRMFHSDEPSEVVGSDEMVAHQDCKDLMGVWQNMHKVFCLNSEEREANFQERAVSYEQQIKELTDTIANLQELNATKQTKLDERADSSSNAKQRKCRASSTSGASKSSLPNRNPEKWK